MAKRNATLVWTKRPGPREFDGVCCWPECQAEVGPMSIPLCIRHHMKAWRVFEDATMWPFIEAWKENHRRDDVARKEVRDAKGVVYFMRFGDRVKIGFTTNLKQRMVDLPNDEVLGTVPGTFADEKRCHTAFAHLRVNGEWFRAEPDLLEFIRDVTAGSAA